MSRESSSLDEEVVASAQREEEEPAQEVVVTMSVFLDAKPRILCLQSSKLTVRVGVSGDVLSLMSAFFATMFSSSSEDDRDKDKDKDTGKHDEEDIVLPEEDPQEAADFLVYLHENLSSPFVDLKWSKAWASLVCKWMMDAFIDEFARLAKDIVHAEEFRPKQPPSMLAEEDKARFWDVASFVLVHEPLKRSPCFDLAAFVKLLACNKELWVEQQMQQLSLNGDDFMHLCKEREEVEKKLLDAKEQSWLKKEMLLKAKMMRMENAWKAEARCIADLKAEDWLPKTSCIVDNADVLEVNGPYRFFKMMHAKPCYIKNGYLVDGSECIYIIFCLASSWKLCKVRLESQLGSNQELCLYTAVCDAAAPLHGRLLPPLAFTKANKYTSSWVSTLSSAFSSTPSIRVVFPA